VIKKEIEKFCRMIYVGGVYVRRIKIENMIYEIRGRQVMLDSIVAMLYGYEVKRINEIVKSNIVRFPEEFCF